MTTEIEINNEITKDFKHADEFVLKVIFLQWLLLSTFGGIAYGNYLFGFINGGLLFLISLITYKLYRGTDILRVSNALVLMSYSIILIQQHLGQIEMHFHIFIMLSFLVAYKDIKPLIAASAYIIIHHLFFTYLQIHQFTLFDVPIVVFNYGCSYNIAFLHAFFVFLELVVLISLTKSIVSRFRMEVINKYEVVALNKEINLANKNLEERVNTEVAQNRLKDAEIIEQTKIAQEKLNKSIALFGENVITSSSDKKGVITYASPAMCQISGYTEEELIGQNHSLLRHEDMPKKLFEDMWGTIKNGKVWDGEIKNKKKNGEYYWVRTSIIPEFDDKNDIYEYVAIRHDITSQKVKEEFMANMSHELRTPLNAIIGFSSILTRSDTKNNMVKQIKLSAESLLSLINDILDLSKIKDSAFSIDPYEFNAYESILQYSGQFEILISQKKIDFKNNIDKELNNVFFGDWHRISQIYVNLVSNAIKFTEENGEISCSMKYVDGALLLVIRDNGIGMSEETQQKVFNQFEQADGSTTRKYGGTGLGLSITQALVQLMNGTIKLESKEHVGSTFSITIPLEKRKNIDSNEKQISNDETQKKDDNLKGHVLIVEDNKTNQMLLEMLIEEFGLTCDIANDGLEAIAMYSPEKHALVLMDENMPNMNGMESMKILKEKHKERCSPIIAVTANAMAGDREKFLNCGMDEYVSKPIDEDKLYQVLFKFLK